MSIIWQKPGTLSKSVITLQLRSGLNFDRLVAGINDRLPIGASLDTIQQDFEKLISALWAPHCINQATGIIASWFSGRCFT